MWGLKRPITSLGPSIATGHDPQANADVLIPNRVVEAHDLR